MFIIMHIFKYLSKHCCVQNSFWTSLYISFSACQVYGWVGGIMGLLSINTLAFIAYDRYTVITNPLEAVRKVSKKKTALSILAIWLWSALWSTPPLFGWGRYTLEGFQTSCTFDYLTHDWHNISFVAGMYFFSFVMPVLIIIMAYTGIVRAMFKHSAEMQSTAKRMGATMSAADKDKRQEFQIAKVSAITVGTFLLSWVPYASVAAIGMIYPHSAKIITPYLSEIPVMFAKASASYNPLIYALSHPKYRAEMYTRFPIFLVCCEPRKIIKGTADSKRTAGDASAMTTQASMELNVVGEIPIVTPAGDNGQCS